MTAPATVRPAEPRGPVAQGDQGGGQQKPPPDDSRPTYLGPTFLAAAAVLAGSSALGTPLTGSSWVLPLVEVVAVIWLVGVGGRLIRLPTTATALLQLGGFVIALTSLFTSTGIGGVLPNKSAVLEAGTLLSGAWSQIVGTSPPAPSTPELSFLISLAIGAAAFIADFLVAEARSPALVALPLLCLYSVPASIAGTMLPWYTFAIPAVLYAGLLAATGSQGRRAGGRAGLGLIVNGTAITVLSTAAALLIASFATGIGTAGRLPHTTGSAGGAVGLSPLASMRGSLQRSDPVKVLTVSGLRGPEYLRTVALTTYTPNQGWSLGPLEADIDGVSGPLSGVPLPTDTRATIDAQGYQDRFLPILSGTDSITGLDSGTWNWDSALNTVYRPDKIKPGSYVISANLVKPTPAQLEADSVVAGGALTDTGALAQSVRDTALQVTRGSTGAFDKARALEQWFTDSANGFVYSLDVPAGNSGDALVDFLTNKQGYCEQYAAAMGVMLRSLNIPTRVVVGFSQGQRQADGSYLVTSHDAHAWVEVKFENNGWVRFDPTPPVDGQGGQQGYTAGPADTTTTAETTAATTTASGASKKADAADTSGATPVSAAPTAIAATSAGTGGSGAGTLVLVIACVLAVLAALCLLPTVIRGRRRGRRLQTAGRGAAGAATAAWAEIEDTAVDHGFVLHSAESARVTANRLARRAHLSVPDRAGLRELVVAAEREWYAGSFAGGGGEPDAAPGAPGGGGQDRGGRDGGGRHEGAADGSVRYGGAAGGTATLLDPAGPLSDPPVSDRPVSDPPVSDPSAVRGADLVACVRSVVAGLAATAPLRGADRVVPRSLRRSAR